MIQRLKIFQGIILFVSVLIFTISCSYKNNLTASNISLHSYYQSNMVFQEDQPIVISGKCSPHGLLAVRIESAMQQIEADDAGDWKAVFPPIDYKRAFNIYIEGKEEIIHLKNLVTGKVWLTIGDSWLEMEKNVLNDVFHSRISNEMVRYYQPSLTFSGSKIESESVWKVVSSGKIKKYEQIVRVLGEELNKISERPIGIINCIWPGTDFINFATKIPENYSFPVHVVPDSAWNDYYSKKAFQSAIEDSSFKGLERGVLDVRLDDYDWGEIDLPLRTGKKWFLKDKVIWFRKRFFVSDKYRTSNFHAQFGTLRGSFIFYINGKKVSEISGEERNFDLEIPDTLLRTWSNLITIRMVTTDSLSGFYSNDLKVVNEDSTYRMGITEGWKYRTYFEPQIEVVERPAFLYPRVKEELLSDIPYTDIEGLVIAGGYPMYRNCEISLLEEALDNISKTFTSQKRIIYLLNKPAYVDSLKHNDVYINKTGEIIQAAASSGYSLIHISDVKQSDLNSGDYNVAVEKLSNELSVKK